MAAASVMTARTTRFKRPGIGPVTRSLVHVADVRQYTRRRSEGTCGSRATPPCVIKRKHRDYGRTLLTVSGVVWREVSIHGGLWHPGPTGRYPDLYQWCVVGQRDGVGVTAGGPDP